MKSIWSFYDNNYNIFTQICRLQLYYYCNNKFFKFNCIFYKDCFKIYKKSYEKELKKYLCGA